MSRVESTLTRLEARLRQLVEGEPVVDGIPHKLHRQLAGALETAMKSCAQRLPDPGAPGSSTLTAPDQYTLLLPAGQAQLLLTHPAELDRLCHRLENSAARSGFVFINAPVLQVVAAPEAAEVKVTTEFSQGGVEDTCTTQVQGLPLGADQLHTNNMPKAFLIINGLTTFPLTESLVNIGRDPSNQVCLDDLRVSRRHAQLRLIKGRFVIFDLDSLGGTFVNEVAVSSHALNPGDVILLAGVPLVYGQEADASPGFTQELQLDPPAPEVL